MPMELARCPQCNVSRVFVPLSQRLLLIIFRPPLEVITIRLLLASRAQLKWRIKEPEWYTK